MLRRLYNMMRKKKEMSETENKKAATFTTAGDGMKPRNVPWGAGLRLPLPVVLAAGEVKTINFLVSCDQPCLIIPMKRCAEYSLAVAEAGQIVLPGQNLTVTFTSLSKSPQPMVLESGEMLVSVHPLVWDGDIKVD